MRPSTSIKSCVSQSGITLIEAMISMLILAITAAGSLYIVSRGNVAKTQMSMQEIAVHELRQRLLTANGVNLATCATPDIRVPNGAGGVATLAVTIEGGCDTSPLVTVTHPGGITAVDGMRSRVVLSVNNALVGGLIRVGG